MLGKQLVSHLVPERNFAWRQRVWRRKWENQFGEVCGKFTENFSSFLHRKTSSNNNLVAARVAQNSIFNNSDVKTFTVGRSFDGISTGDKRGLFTKDVVEFSNDIVGNRLK
jgi:hypothetical protein